MSSLLRANYYDKPEGEDYIGKMAATNRMAIQGAMVAGKLKVSYKRRRWTIQMFFLMLLGLTDVLIQKDTSQQLPDSCGGSVHQWPWLQHS